MQQGKVKWFNNSKGFGFIVPDEGGDDVFAHFSQIQMEGYRTLKTDEHVQFEVTDGPNGKQYILNYDGIIPYHGVVIKHLLNEINQMKIEMNKIKENLNIE